MGGVEPEEEGGALKYAKMGAKVMFSHVGLCILVIAYCVGGAFLFIKIEGDKEMDGLVAGMNRSQEIESEREILAKNLWKHKWSIEFNETVKTLLNEYHENITSAISDHGYGGTRINSSAELSPGWSFPSSLLFTVTIVTTIGYGHIAPSTDVGQLVVIFYSLLGIPLMLMFLANIGDAMANFFRVAYGRGCCYFCWKQRQKNYETNRKRQMRRVKDKDGNKDRPRSAWSDDGKSPRRSRSNSPNDKRRLGTGKSTIQDKDIAMDEMEKGDHLRKRRGSLDSRMSLDGRKEEEVLMMEEPEDEVINVPISLTLVIIAAYIFIGAVIFAAWNKWTWITGAYFSFVTLSTIGFGDLTPGWDNVDTSIGKVKLAVSSFYIVMGLAVLSMSFNLMMEEMIAKFRWLGRKLGIVDDDPPAPPLTMADDQLPLVGNDAVANAAKTAL